MGSTTKRHARAALLATTFATATLVSTVPASAGPTFTCGNKYACQYAFNSGSGTFTVEFDVWDGVDEPINWWVTDGQGNQKAHRQTSVNAGPVRETFSFGPGDYRVMGIRTGNLHSWRIDVS